MLADIEDLVLDEVWLGRSRSVVGGALAVMAVVVLTILWLTVIITPIERSQPDMRSPGVLQRREGTI